MKMKILAGLAGLIIVATGCVSTVAGTKTPAMFPNRDRVEGRYQRSLDQVYQAAVQVMQTDGVLLTEYIPHDNTNSVRSLYGKVNEEKVWMRVESVDPQVTSIIVQSRTGYGGADISLAHELEKEVALQLQAQSTR
jgi:hypothetical protein